MKSYICIICLLLFHIECKAEEAGTFDIGIGGQSNLVVITLDGAYGTTYFKQLFLFGGAKICLNKLSNNNTDNSDITTNILNLNLHTGLRYSIILKKFGAESEPNGLGLFTEARGYFCPWVPRNLSYYNSDGQLVDLHGNYAVQFGYGIAGGIRIGTINEGYIALKYEICSIDPFSTIRNIDTKHYFDSPKTFQQTVSLSFFFR